MDNNGDKKLTIESSLTLDCTDPNKNQTEMLPEFISLIVELQCHHGEQNISKKDLVGIINKIRNSIGPGVSNASEWVNLVENMIKKHREKNRPKPTPNLVKICSSFMHLLAHNASYMHIGELSIIFASLLSEGVLNSPIINYIMLNFALSYEMVSSTKNQTGFLIRNVLRIVYSLQSMKVAYLDSHRCENINSFKLLAYTLFLGNSNNPESIKIINQIVACPYLLSNNLLQFRDSCQTG